LIRGGGLNAKIDITIIIGIKTVISIWHTWGGVHWQGYNSDWNKRTWYKNCKNKNKINVSEYICFYVYINERKVK